MSDLVIDHHLGAGALPAALAIPPTQELSEPMSTRLPRDLIERMDAVAARTGLRRSHVLRLALAEGLPAVERLGQ